MTELIQEVTRKWIQCIGPTDKWSRRPIIIATYPILPDELAKVRIGVDWLRPPRSD